MNIAELVLRHVHQGDADAIVDYGSGRRRSFAVLDDRVRRLSAGLAGEFGLQRGDRVAVLSRNSLEYMEILLACGLGGVLVQAMNWRLSVAELGEILRADPPEVFLFHEEFRREAEELGSIVDCPAWVSWSADGSASELETVVERTGFAPGAVAPFPLEGIAVVLVDRHLLRHPVVWAGAGSDRHLVSLSPDELVRLTRGRVEDVVLESP